MQQGGRFWQTLRRACARYDQLMEKQGFTVVLAVCILVIVLSALYTFHFREQWNEAAQPPVEDFAAGGSQNAQTLQEAQALVQSSPRPRPSEAPFRLEQPVHGFLDRDFSMTEPQLFARARYWRLHPGIDLTAEYGALVSASAAGTVLRVWDDAELGRCVRIRHAYGYETVYAGLSDAGYVKTGDPVYAGQTIGHVGNGVLAESDAEPHLHFEVWKGSTAQDPVEVFLGVDK